MKSPSDNWAPMSSDDERRKARDRYRRDYYAARERECHEPRVREALGVVALCITIAGLVAAAIWLWRA